MRPQPYIAPVPSEYKSAFASYTNREIHIINTMETMGIKKDVKDIKAKQDCHGKQITMNKIKIGVVFGVLALTGVIITLSALRG